MMNLYDPERDGFWNSPSETSAAEDFKALSNLSSVDLLNRMRVLEGEKLRLQALVCRLLYTNEQLRRGNHVME